MNKVTLESVANFLDVETEIVTHQKGQEFKTLAYIPSKCKWRVRHFKPNYSFRMGFNDPQEAIDKYNNIVIAS